MLVFCIFNVRSLIGIHVERFTRFTSGARSTNDQGRKICCSNTERQRFVV